MNPSPPTKSISSAKSEKCSVVALGILLARPAPEPEPRILISQRRSQSVLGGYWEFPGGKIEPGETPTQALEREFYEELGVAVRILEPAPEHILPVIDHAYPHGLVRLIPLWCRLVSGQPRPLQCAQCRWVTPDELPDYPFPPANASLLPGIRRLASHMAEMADPR